MTFFPDDFSIYTIIKDIAWTISIGFAVISNIINIRKNNEIARQKRLMEKEKPDSEKVFEKYFAGRNKKLPKEYIDIIAGINNGLPEIYYDNGYFNIGWNWYIGNSVIILIEKNIFRYTFRVWKEVDGKWLWSEKKRMSDLEKDKELKNRIQFVRENRII